MGAQGVSILRAMQTLTQVSRHGARLSSPPSSRSPPSFSSAPSRLPRPLSIPPLFSLLKPVTRTPIARCHPRARRRRRWLRRPAAQPRPSRLRSSHPRLLAILLGYPCHPRPTPNPAQASPAFNAAVRAMPALALSHASFKGRRPIPPPPPFSPPSTSRSRSCTPSTIFAFAQLTRSISATPA